MIIESLGLCINETSYKKLRQITTSFLMDEFSQLI